MTLNVKSAPVAARKVTKRTGYTRRQLSEISKAEQNDTQGATAERERIAAGFCADADNAQQLIRDTERHADDFTRAALCLRHPTTPATDAVSHLARKAALLGCDAAPLVALMNDAATRARDSARRAQDRLSCR
ncbi:hypothetical protein PH7735_01784 [Shimia thalassica]|uniref:Uncharacterized protein n=1 Tax=Shimia thalassica TaxID=1715693 RepID=A0A0P1I789_9RHOB|nr:hypothetical protein [Shimia thalassica]CUJ94759.1 hypothetical protein PH7735_01784 [Shimia thalassica]